MLWQGAKKKKLKKKSEFWWKDGQGRAEGGEGGGRGLSGWLKRFCFVFLKGKQH